MNDDIGTMQRGERLRPYQAVGIGNHADKKLALTLSNSAPLSSPLPHPGETS
jgi:hypothetical protein